MENGRRSEEQMDSEPLRNIKLYIHHDRRIHICIQERVAVTISGISKFGEIIKLLLRVLRVQRFNYMLERILHSRSHPPLCVGTNLKQKYK